jgi:hypothetical protein
MMEIVQEKSIDSEMKKSIHVVTILFLTLVVSILFAGTSHTDTSRGKTVGQITTINRVTVPSDFPQIEIHQNGVTAPGKIFFGSTFTNVGNYIVIMENDGTPYFYRRYPPENNGSGEFKLQGSGVLTFHLYNPHRYIALDHNYLEIGTLTCQNGYTTDAHELLLPDNGHSLFICQDSLKKDLSQIIPGGSKNATVIENIIQELDENNDVCFEWYSWEHFNMEDASHIDLRSSMIDYVHMNSIAVDYDDNLIISSRHLSEITKIDRKTGEIIWRLGGVHNQFTFVDDSIGFSYQHDARPVPGKPNRYTFFDNGNYLHPEFSCAVEYKIDPVNMIAQKVWEFRYDPDRYSSMMGNVQRLPNGNTFINWPDNKSLWACEVDSNNEIVHELEISNTSTNRVRRFEWEGMFLAPYLIVESYNTGIVLIFNKFGDKNVDYYKIYGDTQANPETLVTTSRETFVFLSDLQNETNWYFRVTAVNINGDESDYSNEEEVYTSFIDPGQNMILNGNFSNGKTNWSLQKQSNASANGSIDDQGQYHIRINNPGTNLWDVQLLQGNIELISGRTYLFEFDAYAVVGRFIEAKIEKNSDPYTNYGEIGYSSLSTKKQHFAYEFKMTYANDLNARVVFNCGQSDGDVYLDNVSFKEVIESGAGESKSIPAQFRLNHNHPNPFNSSTEIGFELPKNEKVTLKVYDLLGRGIKTLVNGYKKAESYRVTFDGSHLSSGIYIYKLQTPSFSQTRKMILMK